MAQSSNNMLPARRSTEALSNRNRDGATTTAAGARSRTTTTAASRPTAYHRAKATTVLGRQ